PLFRNPQFEPTVIVTCVRWYLRFSLSLRDLEELMAERGLSVDHTTIWRWTQAYSPEVYRRLVGEVKRKSSTWHLDETFVSDCWQVDLPVSRRRLPWSDRRLLPFPNTGPRSGQDLLEKGRWPIPMIVRPAYLPETVCAAIPPRFESCRAKASGI